MIEGVIAWYLITPAGGDEDERHGCRVAREETEEIETRRIGPVQVIEEKHERVSHGDRPEEIAHLREQRNRVRDFPHRSTLRERGGKWRETVSLTAIIKNLDPRSVWRCLGEIVASAG